MAARALIGPGPSGDTDSLSQEWPDDQNWLIGISPHESHDALHVGFVDPGFERPQDTGGQDEARNRKQDDEDFLHKM